MVAMFLDFAELQALRRQVVYIKDLEIKLDYFLKLNSFDILNNAGKVSHEEMERIAVKKYEQFDNKRRLKEKEEAEIEAEKDLK